MAERKVECSIELEHDDGVVRAQKWLKGHVIVVVHESVPGAAIAVHLAGHEHTTVPTLVTTISANHLLFDESLCISKLQDEPEVAAGVYRLPFSFYLPAHVPPSIVFDDAKGGTAKVEYLLTVSSIQYNLSVTRTITVVGAPCHAKDKHWLQEPKAIPLKSFGILDQGRLLVAAKVFNSHVAKGERLTCALAVRNESKLELDRIDVVLVETVDWKACAHEKQQTTTITSEQDIVFPGTLVKPTAHPNHGEDISPSTVQEMISYLSWQQNTLELKIPQRALESYSGKLLTVQHALKVLLYMKGRSQHPITALTTDIRVYDPPLEESGHLKNHHQVKPSTTEEVAQTKWPNDADGLFENEESPDVAPIAEKPHAR